MTLGRAVPAHRLMDDHLQAVPSETGPARSWPTTRHTRSGGPGAGRDAMAGSAGPGPLYGELSADRTPDAPVALVLLHGYDADERDLAPLGPLLAPALPWAALRAPVAVASGGHAWFPPIALGDRDPARATDAVWQWIDTHLAREARVVAVGFSQGGLMATQLLRTRPSGSRPRSCSPASSRPRRGRPTSGWPPSARPCSGAGDPGTT